MSPQPKFSPNEIHPSNESNVLLDKINQGLKNQEKDQTAQDITGTYGDSEILGTMRPTKPMIWDIETYLDTSLKPEYKEHWAMKGMGNRVDPVKIEEKKQDNLSKLALDARTGMIIFSGFDLGEDGKEAFGKVGESETKIIRSTWEFMDKMFKDGYRLVTFGGKRFDLPYLLMRSVIKNVNINIRFSYETLIHPYNNFPHLDLETVVTAGGLEDWSYLIGESTTWENQGDKIGDKFEEGDIDWIAAKNANDLSNTMELFKRFEKWL